MRTTLFDLQGLVRKVAITTSITGLVIGTTLPAIAAPSSVSLELGDARVDETSAYTVDMSTVDTGTTLECIEVNLNTAADGGGSFPTGLTSTGSSFSGSSDLITPGSWTVDNTSNGTLAITNTSGETPSASGTLIWDGVTNGSTAETTYYGIISTYTNDDCTGLNETVTVTFVYTNGQLVEVTVDPSLTFDIQAVGAAQSAEATTTVATTDGNVPFGTVTSGTNGVAAHDFQVTTNAAGGYNLYVRDTGDLTHTGNGSATIDDHTGTNASPTTLAGTGEEFGYHADDMPQFGAGEYAAFTTSNEVVMTNSSPTPTTDSSQVTYQVGVANDTDAGTYQTTLIYTITPTF